VVTILDLLNHKRTLLAFIFVGCVLAFLATLLMDKTYKAKVSFVPATIITDDGNTNTIGMLQGVAGSMGINLGGSEDVRQLFPHILRSRKLLERVLSKEYPLSDSSTKALIDYLNPAGESSEIQTDNAIRKLRKKISTSVDPKTGIISFGAIFMDPILAASFANSCVDELDILTRNIRKEHTKHKNDFIKTRLSKTNQQLTDAESKLLDFRKHNHQADSPQLMLVEDRLNRSVNLYQRLQQELMVQQELVIIDTTKDVPLVVILDKATPPTQKHSPQRLRLLISAAIISCMLGLFFVAIISIRKNIQ
jgi:uncharacterized protein involved in exopolysaccharide biosynthesis